MAPLALTSVSGARADGDGSSKSSSKGKKKDKKKGSKSKTSSGGLSGTLSSLKEGGKKLLQQGKDAFGKAKKAAGAKVVAERLEVCKRKGALERRISELEREVKKPLSKMNVSESFAERKAMQARIDRFKAVSPSLKRSKPCDGFAKTANVDDWRTYEHKVQALVAEVGDKGALSKLAAAGKNLLDKGKTALKQVAAMGKKAHACGGYAAALEKVRGFDRSFMSWLFVAGEVSQLRDRLTRNLERCTKDMPLLDGAARDLRDAKFLERINAQRFTIYSYDRLFNSKSSQFVDWSTPAPYAKGLTPDSLRRDIELQARGALGTRCRTEERSYTEQLRHKFDSSTKLSNQNPRHLIVDAYGSEGDVSSVLEAWQARVVGLERAKDALSACMRRALEVTHAPDNSAANTIGRWLQPAYNYASGRAKAVAAWVSDLKQDLAATWRDLKRYLAELGAKAKEFMLDVLVAAWDAVRWTWKTGCGGLLGIVGGWLKGALSGVSDLVPSFVTELAGYVGDCAGAITKEVVCGVPNLIGGVGQTLRDIAAAAWENRGECLADSLMSSPAMAASGGWVVKPIACALGHYAKGKIAEARAGYQKMRCLVQSDDFWAPMSALAKAATGAVCGMVGGVVFDVLLASLSGGGSLAAKVPARLRQAFTAIKNLKSAVDKTTLKEWFKIAGSKGLIRGMTPRGVRFKIGGALFEKTDVDFNAETAGALYDYVVDYTSSMCVKK